MPEVSEKNAPFTSEKEKLSDEYLKREADRTIASCLSGSKDSIQDAYDLRNGVRDNADFAYLWEAYGIEFPSQMRHVPVLRSIFNSLSGKQQIRPFKYSASCTSTRGVSMVMEERKSAILDQITDRIVDTISGSDKITEPYEVWIDQIKDKYNRDFKSELEINSQDVLHYLVQKLKLKEEFDQSFDDLYTAGMELCQIKVTRLGKPPMFRILNPLNVYYTKPDGVRFIKDCPRVLIKERLPVTDVWTYYGHKMKEEDRIKFKEQYNQYIESDIELIAYEHGRMETYRRNEQYNRGLNIPLIDVNYCEWKANTEIEVSESEFDSTKIVEGFTSDKVFKKKKKKLFRLDRFETTRIGSDIYVDMGRSLHVSRDPDDPENVSLTVNGICYQDRNGEPYSLVLKTKDIADKIDILHYHAETLLALSGVKAIAVNFADIPSWMGEDPVVRMMKWLGFVKQGLAVVDYSQPNAGAFQQMSDYDLSISNSIQKIYEMITFLEHTAHRVTGVSRQSVGDISQNDGKGTSQIAVQGSEIVTQPLFSTHDAFVECALTDLLNASRISYSKGLLGTYTMGTEGQRVFSINAKKFPLSYFNVFVNGDGTEERNLDQLRALAMELVKASQIGAETAVDMVTIKSLTEMKQKLHKALENQKESTTAELQSAVEEYKAQLDEALAKIKQYDEAEIQMKMEELKAKLQESQSKMQIEGERLEEEKRNNRAKEELDEKRVNLEALELSYGNANNREIKNN